MAEETEVGKVITPDYAEPIVGWRAWFCFSDSRGRLSSLCEAHVFWGRDETLTAICLRSIYHVDLVPSAKCTCGFYALKRLEQIPDMLDYGYCFTAIGEVELSGRVLICENGYRAEKAKIKSLYEFRQRDKYELGLEYRAVKVDLDALNYKQHPKSNLLLEVISRARGET